MPNDPGVDAFLQAWNALPANYVPQWNFAYSENDGGLYAYPADEYTKAVYRSRFTHEPVWGNNDTNPVTSQALATGQVPGAWRVDAPGVTPGSEVSKQQAITRANYRDFFGTEAPSGWQDIPAGGTQAPADPQLAQDFANWQRQIQAGNATRDEFQGPVANIFGNAFTLPAAFAGGMIGANAAGNIPAVAGQAGVRLTQNPTGGGTGGALGSVASAATGVPGLSAVGSLIGGLGQQALQGSGGKDTMAEPYIGQSDGSGGNNAWLQILPQLLAVAPGLLGSGINLASMPEVLKRLETLYTQSQGNFQQQTQYAQAYQGLLNLYQQQQQQAYAAQTGERAADRATRNQAYQAHVGETAQDRASRDTAYQAQVGETAADRANKAQANIGRAGVAGRLSDPTQVAAGAQQIYQPMSQAMTDHLLRGVQRDLAMRGQSDGGAASRATADAMAPYYNQLQQQAMSNFLASQGQALNAYNPLTGSYTPSAPQGPYTPDAPQGPYTPSAPQPAQPSQLPRVPDYIPGSNAGPQANQQQGYQQLSNQIAQLGKLLAGTGLLQGGGGLDKGESAYGSDIPGMTEGYDPGAAQSYFNNLYSGSGLTGGGLEDFSYLDDLTF